jgi:MoaA/NifB/PqqE/SkfB family radical SAM enzyme
MLYSLKNTQVFEIELTNYCNAFCGACDRNIRGGSINSSLRLKHMDENVWKSLISADNLKYIKEIHFDGNFGDAIMHPKLIEFLDYLADVKTNLTIKLSTNGGARDKMFWKNLAQSLNKFDYHYVQFAIDGLEDTNHIYRRGVLWNKLLENVKTFIENNGYAQWRAIVFDHNKHQLSKMAETAKTLGFSKFKTYRNRETPILTDAYKEFLKSRITSPSVDEFEKQYKIFYSWNKNKIPLLEHIQEDTYDCPFGKERIIVIDPFGNLWPCCFIQGNQVTQHKQFPYNKYLQQNNISKNSLTHILEFFQNDLYSAWKNDTYTICNNCLHKKNKPTQHNV